MSEYNASAIEILSDIESVRTRPARFIETGSGSDIRPLFFLWGEAFGNAIDEAMAGHADTIWTTVEEIDGRVWVCVKDNGRGLPIDIHPKAGMITATALVMMLNSGGKFGGGGYAGSTTMGLHGVGMVCTNALSRYMEMTVNKKGHVYKQTFERGEPTSEFDQIGESPKDWSSGTQIRFTIDTDIRSASGDVVGFDLGPNAFKNTLQAVQDHLNAVKWILPPRLSIYLNGERLENLGGGVSGAYENKFGEGEDSPGPWWTAQGDLGDIAICTGRWKLSAKDMSWANTLPTPQGGSHVSALRYAVEDAFLAQYKGTGRVEDIWEVIRVAIAANVADPQFQGQTKYKLTGCKKYRNQLRSWIGPLLARYWEVGPGSKVYRWLESHVNSRAAERKKLMDSAQRNAAMASKRRYGSLPVKLAVASKCKAKDRELFLVEGDSAGGTAKMGRNRHTQEVLPLRGKILNAEKVSESRILANQEVDDIAASIGGGFGEHFDLSSVRINKLILLSDADPDGAHIDTLILTLLAKRFWPLLEAGMVYVVDSPLYIGKRRDGSRVFGREYKDVEKCVSVSRLKGHGEANAKDLAHYAMNPATRHLYRLRVTPNCKEHITKLMGSNSAYRRELLGLFEKETI